MNYDYEAVKELQSVLANKVITYDDFYHIRRVCGIDVSYSHDVAYCSAVVMANKPGQPHKIAIVETVDSIMPVSNPYIPGFLMLREAEPILKTLRLLKDDYDLLLVDGHGLLHPRKCGLACYVGIMLDKPTVGIAKSRLCGIVRKDGYVEVGKEILGCVINKLYVSVGHKISLETAIAIVKEFGTEPLRIADIHSKAQRRRKERGASG